MPRYSSGQPVRLSTTTSTLGLDGSYTLADAGTLTLTVQKPDATQVVYSSPSHDATGTYHQDCPVSDLGQVGHYQYKWTSTGTAAGESVGDFDVFDPFEVALLPLQDAKDMLNIPQSNTAPDAEISSWIATIETSLEAMTGGPIVNRQVTERVEVTSGYTVLAVRQRPLVSLQAVKSASSGQALSIADMTDLDPNAGTIRRSLGLPFFGPYFSWLPIFNVTYTAGWGTAVPAAFNSAARIILRHLWDTQRGVTPGPMLGGGETGIVPGFSFAIPNRAIELLNGSLNGMPFRQEAFV